MNSIILPTKLTYQEAYELPNIQHTNIPKNLDEIIKSEIINPTSILTRTGKNKITPIQLSNNTIHIYACIQQYKLIKPNILICSTDNYINDFIENYRQNVYHEPINITTTKSIQNINNKYDFIIIDTKNNTSPCKLNYGDMLSNKGNLLIISDYFTGNDMIKYMHLSTYFKESHIYKYLHAPSLIHEYIIFKNYNNNEILNKKMYPDKSIFDKYWKMYETKIQEESARNDDIMVMYNNVSHKILKKDTYELAILLAKQFSLELYDWIDIDETLNNYYQKGLSNVLNTLLPYKHKIRFTCKHEKIGLYDNITGSDFSILTDQYHISEKVYTHVDSIDKKSFQNVELLFNFNQKKLEKFLFVKHNINTNNRYVNRAWIKLFELYKETKYFDNIKNKTVKGFHICEAPGNFISSSIYYLKNTNKSYDWTAQSLVKGDIFDEYGFIKNNKDKWDFGPNNNGDIMLYENLKYYMDKYKNIDSLVGDCGVPWTANNKKNTAAAQLIYAMLLVKVGGNFVIKLLSTNADLLFMSLLYCTSCRFDNVYIFKSSRNIWSSEIYIVGIGKKKILNDDENNLIKIFKGLNKNKVTYPVKSVGNDFFMEYAYVNNITLVAYSKIKKFFTYLAYDNELFVKEKNNIADVLDKKNIFWLNRYMNFINGIADSYVDYNE